MPNEYILKDITRQIVDMFFPLKILLFGSHAKARATNKSDIDLCVVADSDNKRKTLTEMYYNIDCEKPIDIMLYTPSEWDELVTDSTSFAYKINTEGVVLYG